MWRVSNVQRLYQSHLLDQEAHSSRGAQTVRRERSQSHDLEAIRPRPSRKGSFPRDTQSVVDGWNRSRPMASRSLDSLAPCGTREPDPFLREKGLARQ